MASAQLQTPPQPAREGERAPYRRRRWNKKRSSQTTGENTSDAAGGSANTQLQNTSTEGQPPISSRPPRNRNTRSGTPQPEPTSNMDSGNPAPTQNHSSGRNRGRRHRKKAETEGEPSEQTLNGPPPNAGRRRGFGAHLSADAPGAPTVSSQTSTPNESRLEQPLGPQESITDGTALNGDPVVAPRPRQRNRRGKQRVEGSTESSSQSTTHIATRSSPPTGPEDLSTRIHREISSGEYECMICFGGVTRQHEVWYCRCCSAVFHLKCVKKWAKQGLQAKHDGPVGADGEPPRTWRCPGCNNPTEEVPEIYTCWCEKVIQPESSKYLSPHSCGQTCGKKRTIPNKCPHACDKQCHAGPCPPCTALGPSQACFCGKESSQKLCTNTDYENGWSCGEICGDLMPCGEHFCAMPCHPSLCGACQVPDLLKCYCGNEMKEIRCCDKGEPKESSRSDTENEIDTWSGHFQCDKTCNRLLACGKHRCGKGCHPQDVAPGTCPSDPSVVTHCPCRKTPLTEITSQPRATCEDPIPTCEKVCDKVLPCGHLCPKICHAGECGSCRKTADIACRCGKTISRGLCPQGFDYEPPHCMRNCKVALNCGRHECGEKCCSGEQKANERLAVRKRMRGFNSTASNSHHNEGFEPEHICTRPCGRLLKCGKHNCPMLCHRGPCGTCLEASFEELPCNCGRTVIQPPVPCGTAPPPCRHPCTRPKACGHPLVPHDCHQDDESCPKCPYLTEKPCICGKKIVKSVPCWLGSASCGLPCGKKLSCGSHACRKTCHEGDCEEPCKQQCGKAKNTCGHPCLDVCHAPFQCSEDKPCQEKVRLSCSCGGVTQDVKCGATKAKPEGNKQKPPCTDACRSKRLAIALGVDPDRESTPLYSEETIAAYNRDKRWSAMMEEKVHAFALNQEQKRINFTPMRAPYREFLHLIAADLGLDSESQDPEPYRSVVLRKLANFVPAQRKTIAEYIASKPNAAALTPVAVQQLKKIPRGPAVNSFILKGIKVGLLAPELEKELLPLLNESQLRFNIVWYGDEEVLLRPKPSSLAVDQIEAELRNMSTKLKRIVTSKGLADSTELCWVGQDGKIASSESDKWNLVNSKKAAPITSHMAGGGLSSRNAYDLFNSNSAATVTAMKEKPSSSLKKAKSKEEVVDDWEMEAEELD